jgi:hypothetical protein
MRHFSQHHRISSGVWLLGLFLILGWMPQLSAKPGEEAGRSWTVELRGGILAHDVNHLWSNMHVEGGIDFNMELVLFHPSLKLLTGFICPNLGVTINSLGYTSKLYAGFLWEWQTRSGLFLDLGLGAAVHDGELNDYVPGRKLLGARILFRIPVELGYRISARWRLSLMFSHISNGYTAEYNQGLDVLGLRISYRL